MTRLIEPCIGAAVLAGLLAFGAGCQELSTDVQQRIRTFVDSDRDGLMEEVEPADGDGIVVPYPGDCPVLQWTETHTTQTGPNGDVLSETWEICTQCLNEDGTPVGEPECMDEPPPPPFVCEEYDSGDPQVSCYRCFDEQGQIIVDECSPVPGGQCWFDDECPDGYVCEWFDALPLPGPQGPQPGGPGTDPGDGDPVPTDPMDPPPPPPGGICVPSNPVDDCFVDADCPDGQVCYYVDQPCEDNPEPGPGVCGPIDPCVIELGPDGSVCWICVDPMSGETNGWCDGGQAGCIVETQPDGTVCTTCVDPVTGDTFTDCDDGGDNCTVEVFPDGTVCTTCVDPITGDVTGSCESGPPPVQG